MKASFGNPRTGAPGARPAARCRLLALLALAQISAAGAQEAAGPELPELDISGWACKYCDFQQGWRSEIELGIGSVAEDSFKFGEYNGLDEEGSYLIGDARAVYRGEDAAWMELSATDIGLDSRSLSIEGGRQGRYALFLHYDEIPHLVADSASTPYLGAGGDRLSLPPGWVTAGNTAGMTALSASLQDVELETTRKRLATGISVVDESPWSYRVDLRHDEKDGNKAIGGAFFFNTAQLVEPVDYVTDEVEAAVTYTRKDWQASLGYYGSSFSNENAALNFDNAYNPIVAGADEGQLALPPDNEFHQLSLAAAYRFSERNQLSVDYAVGRMQQDEKLLQATVNPTLVVPALPADSADAEIETTNARLKFVSRATDRLLLAATYSLDERDNKTPQMIYDWVTTDAFLAARRGNLPYSYTRETLQLEAGYDYSEGTRLGLGYDQDQRERTFQEVDETTEDSLWGSIRIRNIENLFVEFRIAASSRDASSSAAVAAIDPAQNPLMTKYYLAERDRRSMSLHANYLPHPDITVGLSLDHARDDYDASEIGLTAGSDDSINIDVAAILSETTTANVYVGRQRIDSSQANSQSFADPDWVAEIRDQFEIVGLGINHVLIEEVLNIGIDVSRSLSRGEIELDAGAPAQGFPDLTTELRSVKLYLDYRVDENLKLRAAYWHETYDSSDWALEGVEPDTVGNLLAFGVDTPEYDNDVFKLSMSYSF